MNVIMAIAKIISLAGIAIASIVIFGTVGALELDILTCCEAMARIGFAFLGGLIGFIIMFIIDKVEAVNDER